MRLALTPASTPYAPASSASRIISAHAEAAIADTSWLRHAVAAAGVTRSATEPPSTTVAGPVPTHSAERPARVTVTVQRPVSHSRSREPPRSQASTTAPAVAGTATAAGRATH